LFNLKIAQKYVILWLFVGLQTLKISRKASELLKKFIKSCFFCERRRRWR